MQKYVNICCKQYGRLDHLTLLKKTTLKLCEGGCSSIIANPLKPSAGLRSKEDPQTSRRKCRRGFWVSQPQTGKQQPKPRHRDVPSGKPPGDPEAREARVLSRESSGDPGGPGPAKGRPAEPEGKHTHSRKGTRASCTYCQSKNGTLL